MKEIVASEKIKRLLYNNNQRLCPKSANGTLVRVSPVKSERSFKDWASLFSGKLFVKVVAYVDESGTHDRTGALKGSAHVVIAGLVDWRDDWSAFCSRWQLVLNKYSAPYFHFKEWSEASRVAREVVTARKDFHKNPYQGWETERLDNFLLELGEIAGDGNRIVTGGWINTAEFHQAATSGAIDRKTIPARGDPYQHCLNNFFANLPSEILSAWPDWNEPVSIFYDWTDDPKWRRSILDAHGAAKQKDSRIGELTFANKKDAPHLPLQAADMVVYRFRQLAETVSTGTIPTPSALDRLILKSMFNQFGEMLKRIPPL